MIKKIVSVRETVKLTPAGELARWRVVEYMLDDFGPFTVETPKDAFTWDGVKEDMRREEEGLADVTK